MGTLNELGRRVAVAGEKNRQNAERRETLLADAKTRFGCGSAEELEAFSARRGEEAAEKRRAADEALVRAEEAVSALEAAVGGIR